MLIHVNLRQFTLIYVVRKNETIFDFRFRIRIIDFQLSSNCHHQMLSFLSSGHFRKLLDTSLDSLSTRIELALTCPVCNFKTFYLFQIPFQEISKYSISFTNPISIPFQNTIVIPFQNAPNGNSTFTQEC